jgi:CRISPR-associated endonuclease Cas2
MPDPMQLWVFVYDVRDAGRQKQVRDCLRFAGSRVQDCVYEVAGSKTRLRRLIEELAFLLGPDDGMRVYRVCKDCRQETTIFGEGRLTSRPVVIIL